MKQTLRLLTFLVILALAVTLVGCSSINKIDKALTEIGYEKIESNDDAKDTKKDAEESEYSITVHVYSNKNNISVAELLKVNTIMVLEFKATKDMKEYYEQSNTLQGLIKDIQEDGSAEEFYNKLVEKGYANGNCLVFSFNLLVADEVKTAIKGA